MYREIKFLDGVWLERLVPAKEWKTVEPGNLSESQLETVRLHNRVSDLQAQNEALRVDNGRLRKALRSASLDRCFCDPNSPALCASCIARRALKKGGGGHAVSD